MLIKVFAATATSLFALLPISILLPFSSAIASESSFAPSESSFAPSESSLAQGMEPDAVDTPLPESESLPQQDTEPVVGEIILLEEGELRDGDPVLPTDGSLFHQHTFFGEAGKRVKILLESSEFDTYLALFNPQDELLEENDDIDETNTNSRIIITLPETGTYRVIVNSYDATGRGRYQLRVSEVE
ncbi:PPC domain-containing protein [Limnospira fusiformis]|uniref:PPC domain-containing protein n=1 Tax=Limnospira fusiformis TaxID=54297 RepID=UPI00144A0664|nr:peptidase [Limnospira fusiformis SAG 85.79]